MSGDCGGTNTRLVLFRVPEGASMPHGEPPPGEVVFSQKYLNSSYESFSEVCKAFLSEAGALKPAACCLACAGAIADQKVSFTNIERGWAIDGRAISVGLGIPKVRLINDFEAQGYGLLTLRDSEKRKLNDGVPQPGAPIACVGAGTGLGECYLTSDKSGVYTCWPSEGGHAEFAPRNALTHDLRDFLAHKFDTKDQQMLGGSRAKRVSVERIISGPGLAHVYEFLREHWAFRESVGAELDVAFLAAPAHESGAVVARGAREGDLLCTKAVSIFSECYGSEAGVAALKWMPYGGLYVSGGIAAKNPSWIESDAFLGAYKDKGRLSPMVESVPLYLVLTEDTGERGALLVAVQMLLE